MAAHQLDAAIGHGHGLAFGNGAAVDVGDLDVAAFEVVVAQHIDGDGLLKARARPVVKRILLGRDVHGHRGRGLAALAVVHDHRELVRARAAPVLVGDVGVLAVRCHDHGSMSGRSAQLVGQWVTVLVLTGDLAVERLIFTYRNRVAAIAEFLPGHRV